MLKNRYRLHFLLLFLWAACCWIPAQAVEFNTAMSSIRATDIKTHIDVLADDSFEGREAGSRGGRAAAGYLAQRFQKLGLIGGGDRGSYYQNFNRGYRNILGVLEGSDDRLKDEYVLVGAHYDHVGYGNRKNSFGPWGYVHNGADDNASGVAGVLEVAEAFVSLDQPPKRSVLFALWDGEEQGLVGSKHWTAHPTVPLRQLVLACNADMIGRLRPQSMKVIGSRSAPGLRRLVSSHNRATDLSMDFTWELKANSDHHPFFARHVPILMLHTGLHNDYHRPRDDAHTINHDGAQHVARLMFGVVHDVANSAETAPFRVRAKQESPSDLERLEQALPPKPARLGISWQTRFGDSGGLFVTRVVPGSPADDAGLEVGDQLLRFEGRDVINEDELRVDILAAQSPAEIVVQRDDTNTLTVPVELAGSPMRLGISWREDDSEPGTLVLSRVVGGSAAGLAGLRVADRIYQVAGQDFQDGHHFLDLIATLPGSIELLVERNGRLRTVRVDLPSTY